MDDRATEAAERRVVECELRASRMRRLIERLDEDGYDTTVLDKALSTLEAQCAALLQALRRARAGRHPDNG